MTRPQPFDSSLNATIPDAFEDARASSSVPCEMLMMPSGRSWSRQLLLEVATRSLRPVMSRRARRLLLRHSRRVHLGCGYTILPGWLNVDLVGRTPADVGLDMKKPLPFADVSVDAIFTEHMVEHLTYTESLALMRECSRVLRPGGVLRIVVPDFELYIRSYIEKHQLAQPGLSAPLTPLLGLARIAYGSSHRSIWDAETLTALLNYAGLHGSRRQFRESDLDPCPDTPAREFESLYVEAVKEPDGAAFNGSRVSTRRTAALRSPMVGTISAGIVGQALLAVSGVIVARALGPSTGEFWL